MESLYSRYIITPPKNVEFQQNRNWHAFETEISELCMTETTRQIKHITQKSWN